MRRAVVFGGTSDGRILAGRLAAIPVQVVVSVATDYGRDVLAGLPPTVRVVAGRLDKDGMLALFDEVQPEWIIDATHPYAVAASMTIRQAAATLGREPLRLYRPPSVIQAGPGCETETASEWNAVGRRRKTALEDDDVAADVRFFPTLEEAALDLEHTDERVLLAIGAKGLGAFVGIEHYEDRLFPRVLPTEESIQECRRHGYRRDHIIAMQGPFSEELNLAILNQFGINALVTKDGGDAGGLGEKLAAARRGGCRVLVIGRPIGDGGLTLEEIVGRIGRDVETV